MFCIDQPFSLLFVFYYGAVFNLSVGSSRLMNCINNNQEKTTTYPIV